MQPRRKLSRMEKRMLAEEQAPRQLPIPPYRDDQVHVTRQPRLRNNLRKNQATRERVERIEEMKRAGHEMVHWSTVPITPPSTRTQREAFDAKRRHYWLPAICPIRGKLLNEMWALLEYVRKRDECRYVEGQYISRPCRVYSEIEARLSELSSADCIQRYWPRFPMLIREMRKLYYQKVNVLTLILRNTDIRLPITTLELKRAMLPTMANRAHDPEVTKTIMTDTNMRREINCILEQMHLADKIDIPQTVQHFRDILQWPSSVRAYLRVLADHTAKKLLNNAQLSRGTAKRIHPMHVLLAGSDERNNVNALLGNANPFGREFTHLRHCRDKIENEHEQRRRERRGQRRRYVYKKDLLPYTMGELGKLCTVACTVELHQPDRILYAVNQHVHAVLSNIVRRCATLVLGRTGRRRGVHSRVRLVDIMSISREYHGGLKLAVDPSADVKYQVETMTVNDALDIAYKAMYTAHEDINRMLHEYLCKPNGARGESPVALTPASKTKRFGRRKGSPVVIPLDEDIGASRRRRGGGGGGVGTTAASKRKAATRFRKRRASTSSTGSSVDASSTPLDKRARRRPMPIGGYESAITTVRSRNELSATEFPRLFFESDENARVMNNVPPSTVAGVIDIPPPPLQPTNVATDGNAPPSIAAVNVVAGGSVGDNATIQDAGGEGVATNATPTV